LRPFIAGEIPPRTEKTSDRGINAHIRATGVSVHHLLGTCRMGTEDDAATVVDGELRVLEVERPAGSRRQRQASVIMIA